MKTKKRLYLFAHAALISPLICTLETVRWNGRKRLSKPLEIRDIKIKRERGSFRSDTVPEK